ncbi:hypothetical protein QT971_12370 [Microcoleus sp. herbarium19]
MSVPLARSEASGFDIIHQNADCDKHKVPKITIAKSALRTIRSSYLS